MEEKTTSIGQSTMYYGALLGVGIIVASLLLYILDYHESYAAFFVVLAVLVAGVAFITLEVRKKTFGGFMSYGKAFKVGFLAVLYASILLGVYTFVFHSYIDDSMIIKQRKESVAGLEEQFPNAASDPEQAEGKATAKKYIDIFVSPVTFALVGFIMWLVIGIIVTLITSIFIKKEEFVRLN